MLMSLNPWGESQIDDYDRVCKEFGIEEIDEEITGKMKDNRFFRRRIIFGHRDFGNILKAVDAGKPWAVMSGIKPSGAFHLGTFTTASEIVELQKMGGKAYYCIADIESWQDNGIPYEESASTAIDNLADILAVGLDPERAYIWRQSQEPTVKSTPYFVSKGVTNNMLRAIYGEHQFGLYLSALVQVADILLPQLREYPMPTVVPVGIDQDPHIRLTRDLTRKYYQKKHGFFLPGATYHRLLEGLDGSDKMSKRNPNSYFTFEENEKTIKRKLQNALTGGRDTLQEQRDKGGRPAMCMIHKLLTYHFLQDDKKLMEIYEECKAGNLLCGECKKFAIDTVLSYVRDHGTRKKKLLPTARKILDLDE
ncbi:tryptophan--tRNA ligase [Candidatus Bathyarchaeota archaeon]|nr:tryptophan--tRNA ligase [Candidatus Bathyarchaeota archaeon]